MTTSAIVQEILATPDGKTISAPSVAFLARCIEHAIRGDATDRELYHIDQWNLYGLVERARENKDTL